MQSDVNRCSWFPRAQSHGERSGFAAVIDAGVVAMVGVVTLRLSQTQLRSSAAVPPRWFGLERDLGG
jgi:hypothetical protein